jgi:predicted esterase
VGLHGLGASAPNFVDASYQHLADRLGVAFVGVSGTLANGPKSFRWAEDPARDARRVGDALQEIAGRVAVARDKVILFGFSQGGAVAADLVARDPEHFAGAIVLSPGGREEPHYGESRPSALLHRRGMVFVCGAGEHPSTVRRTEHGAAWFTQAGARVEHKAYVGMTAHALPPGFEETLPRWIELILDAQTDPKKDIAP